MSIFGAILELKSLAEAGRLAQRGDLQLARGGGGHLVVVLQLRVVLRVVGARIVMCPPMTTSTAVIRHIVGAEGLSWPPDDFSRLLSTASKPAVNQPAGGVGRSRAGGELRHSLCTK